METKRVLDKLRMLKLQEIFTTVAIGWESVIKSHEWKLFCLRTIVHDCKLTIIVSLHYYWDLNIIPEIKNQI